MLCFEAYDDPIMKNAQFLRDLLWKTTGNELTFSANLL